MLNDQCFCASRKDGSSAGCSCIKVVDGPNGPRVVESASSRGDGLAAALARQAQERADAATNRVPPGAITRESADRAQPDQVQSFAVPMPNTLTGSKFTKESSGPTGVARAPDNGGRGGPPGGSFVRG